MGKNTLKKVTWNSNLTDSIFLFAQCGNPNSGWDYEYRRLRPGVLWPSEVYQRKKSSWSVYKKT